MGEEITSSAFTDADFEAFEDRLYEETALLVQWRNEGRFSEGDHMAGEVQKIAVHIILMKAQQLLDLASQFSVALAIGAQKRRPFLGRDFQTGNEHLSLCFSGFSHILPFW